MSTKLIASSIMFKIQSDVEWAGECELPGEDTFDRLAITRRESSIYISYDLRSGHHSVLLHVTDNFSC